jgi:hypothetical protein
VNSHASAGGHGKGGTRHDSERYRDYNLRDPSQAAMYTPEGLKLSIYLLTCISSLACSVNLIAVCGSCREIPGFFNLAVRVVRFTPNLTAALSNN